MTNSTALDQWIATRPPAVRALAAEFPLMTKVWIPSAHAFWFVIGWTENDMLLVSPYPLDVDYHRSYGARQRVCAEHYR